MTDIAGCGAPQQGKPLDPAVSASETVIQGVVTAGSEPVGSAYVRLLDGTGEFTAEVVSSAQGEFRFFAAPGSWTLRALSAKGNGETAVVVTQGLNSANVAVAG